MEHEEFLMLPVNQLVSTIYVKSTFKFLDKELKIVPILINISHFDRFIMPYAATFLITFVITAKPYPNGVVRELI